MMRTKLQLTEKELMKSSWIGLSLQMADFPYYDHKSDSTKGKNIVIKTKEDADRYLSKYMNRGKKK